MDESIKRRIRVAHYYSTTGILLLVFSLLLLLWEKEDLQIIIPTLIFFFVSSPLRLAFTLTGRRKYKHLIRDGVKSVPISLMLFVDEVIMIPDICITSAIVLLISWNTSLI
jgi:hypothetical protein